MEKSPPKPWENTSLNAKTLSPNSDITTAEIPPPRPNSMPYAATPVYNNNNSIYSNPYGNTMSPYAMNSRYGSMSGGYGSMGGAYGSMGGGYGGYGSGYGSTYGSPYGVATSYQNRASPYGGPPGQFPPGQLQSGYQSAFQVLEQIVGTFGGLAHMLDSTLMATHSSFMAMVGLAEQYAHLKHFLVCFYFVISLQFRVICFLWLRFTPCSRRMLGECQMIWAQTHSINFKRQVKSPIRTNNPPVNQ